MKRIKTLLFGIGVFLFTQTTAFAGPPFNNLEGVGGIAFNPLAYTAGTSVAKDAGEAGYSYKDFISKPQIGFWYVNLGQTNNGIDWTTIGIAETFFKRFEVSYGHEVIGIGAAPKNIYKDNLGGKLLLLEENFKGLNYLPAISVGAIYKKTSSVNTTEDDSDSAGDFYLVATKLIPQLPVPVLLSGGALSTKGKVTGVLGYDKDRATTFFGNIDIIPFKQIALGFEYKKGARFDDFKNADYWNAHAAWFASDKLTLIAAYVNAGDKDATDGTVGLGNGVVLSAQYAF